GSDADSALANGDVPSRANQPLPGAARSSGRAQKPAGLVVLTTVNALVQRMPPRHLFDGRVLTLGPGGHIPLDRLQSFLRNNGYIRTDTVREPGEFARSEERRVGKECRSRWAASLENKIISRPIQTEHQ